MPGFLSHTGAVMRREMHRLTHQPMYFVLMIVLPVVSFAFFALLFNQGAIRNIPIAVLDEDDALAQGRTDDRRHAHGDGRL